MDYLPRVVDERLVALRAGSRAVSVVGPRGVGKTVSASRGTRTVVRLDDPVIRQIVSADRYGYLAAAEPPVLVDEWQLDPPVWDAVRRLVDDDPLPGRFVLTGSADPAGARLHPGAGRFIRLRMRPLAFSERRIEQPTVSLNALWSGDGEVGGSASTTLRGYAEEIVASGLPGARQEPATVRLATITDYVEHMIEHEVPGVGELRHRPASLRNWLTAYAAASSSTASFQAISAAVDQANPPSRATVIDYRDALSRLWLLDEVPAWQPGGSALRQLGLASKHQLADPALAARLLSTSADGLVRASGPGDTETRLATLRNAPLLGALFESLVTLTVRVLAESLGVRVGHLRTHRGEHEIDLIVHADDGRVLAIEVKLTAAADDRDVRHLNWLHDKLGDRLVDRMVVTTGPRAYRRADGVAVVPLALLGP